MPPSQSMRNRSPKSVRIATSAPANGHLSTGSAPATRYAPMTAICHVTRTYNDVRAIEGEYRIGRRTQEANAARGPGRPTQPPPAARREPRALPAVQEPQAVPSSLPALRDVPRAPGDQDPLQEAHP